VMGTGRRFGHVFDLQNVIAAVFVQADCFHLFTFHGWWPIEAAAD